MSIANVLVMRLAGLSVEPSRRWSENVGLAWMVHVNAVEVKLVATAK
jgi:hypothetical protein